MALTVTHATTVAVPDDGTSPIGSDEWNATHAVTGAVDLTTQFPSGSTEQILKTRGGAAAWEFDEQWTILAAAYTLNNVGTAQKLFNSSTNGAVAVENNTVYFFECAFQLSSMSATSGNIVFDVKGAGTSTLSSAALTALGADTSTPATALAVSGLWAASTANAGALVLAAVGTGMFVFIKGVVRVTVAGTLIPSVTLANASAAVVAQNSWFRIWKSGVSADASLQATVGNWT
jgi:hypothetical protein